jgi:hypothetical protein
MIRHLLFRLWFGIRKELENSSWLDYLITLMLGIAFGYALHHLLQFV